jgi:hypothetical protein
MESYSTHERHPCCIALLYYFMYYTDKVNATTRHPYPTRNIGCWCGILATLIDMPGLDHHMSLLCQAELQWCHWQVRGVCQNGRYARTASNCVRCLDRYRGWGSRILRGKSDFPAVQAIRYRLNLCPHIY